MWMNVPLLTKLPFKVRLPLGAVTLPFVIVSIPPTVIPEGNVQEPPTPLKVRLLKVKVPEPEIDLELVAVIVNVEVPEAFVTIPLFERFPPIFILLFVALLLNVPPLFIVTSPKVFVPVEEVKDKIPEVPPPIVVVPVTVK